MTIDIVQIERSTSERGANWAVPHALRLIELAARIAVGIDYDVQAFRWAAFLHDWGAFTGYKRPGYPHPLCSREIAESEILPQTNLTPRQQTTILEAIALHDYRDLRIPRSIEALLLREADGLDLLGAVGIAREFAWGPNNLAVVVDRIHSRLDEIPARLTLPAAKAIAVERVPYALAFLARLQEESGGIL
jgi:uncharacterized protein